MPEELISLREIMTAVFIFIWNSLKFIAKIPFLSKRFVFADHMKLNIWDIYKEEWIYSFSGSYLIGGLLYYYAFNNLIRNMQAENKPVIIYPSELYAWENALNIAASRKKAVKTVGVQHTSLPLLLLNYFNDPQDLVDEKDHDGFPMPDYLASPGKIPKKIMLDNGWPESRISELGAIRYNNLSRFFKERIPWELRDKKIVVALSSAKEEVEEMIELLWQAFRDKKENVFILKSHPACPIDSIIRCLGIDVKNSNFTTEPGRSLEDLMMSSRAVIVGGSSASIDALICQCPVIIPRLSCMVDLNPLSNVAEDLVYYAASEEELINIVNLVLRIERSPMEFNRLKTFIGDYFTIAGSGDGYYERLQKEMLNK